MRHALFSVILATALSACGSSTTEDTHGISTDPAAAIGFYTANLPTPDTAADIRGDGVLRDADERPYHYAGLGTPLPAFEDKLQDGSIFSSEAIDQWTVIYVWGTWCGDCRRDGPYVSQVAAAIAEDPNLDFVSIHTPASAARADEAFQRFGSLGAYFEQVGYEFPTIIDEDASLREQLNVSWTPTYLLVSPDGVVHGFRTDLSVAGDKPVATFLGDVASARSETNSS